MKEPTRPSPPDEEPGHYGAGYGEQVPDDAPPQLGPATDGDAPPGVESTERRDSTARDTQPTTQRTTP